MKNPLEQVGKPLVYHNNPWWKRNHIKRVHKLADKCAEYSGKQHHVIIFGSGAMIINAIWRKNYNKNVPRGGRISVIQIAKEAVYSTKLKR